MRCLRWSVGLMRCWRFLWVVSLRTWRSSPSGFSSLFNWNEDLSFCRLLFGRRSMWRFNSAIPSRFFFGRRSPSFEFAETRLGQPRSLRDRYPPWFAFGRRGKMSANFFLTSPLSATRPDIYLGGCPAWTRTMNNASKGHCVTITPQGKQRFILPTERVGRKCFP